MRMLEENETMIINLNLDELEKVRTLEENEQIYDLGTILQGAVVEQIKRLKQYKGKRGSGINWEKYCKDRLKISVDQADNIIKAFKVYKNLALSPTIVGINTLPNAESQTRSIANLPPAKQVEVWNKAVEKSGGKVPTAKIVKEVAEEDKPKTAIVKSAPVEQDPAKATLGVVLDRVNRESNEAFLESVKDFKLSEYRADVDTYNEVTVKGIFEEIWNRLTKYTTPAYKKRLAGDLVAWMFKAYPTLLDEFQLR